MPTQYVPNGSASPKRYITQPQTTYMQAPTASAYKPPYTSQYVTQPSTQHLPMASSPVLKSMSPVTTGQAAPAFFSSTAQAMPMATAPRVSQAVPMATQRPIVMQSSRVSQAPAGYMMPQQMPTAAPTVGIKPLPESLLKNQSKLQNNIILMTDGYKFSHHKQYPVSWMPPRARPQPGDPNYFPPILFPGAKILSIKPVPCNAEDVNRVLKLTIVTNVSTAVVVVEAVGNEVPADFQYSGSPLPWNMPVKESYVVALNGAVAKALKMPYSNGKYRFSNNDESKNKRGSNMNMNFEGGYNVSYFTPRVYNEMFSDLTGDQIVFFGLQYYLKEYCTGKIITPTKIDEADAFIGRYMADVRIAGDSYEDGYDYTMFPRGDWEAMATGDYDETGMPNQRKAGMLPIRVEALPEGTLQEPGVCSFKITNTHPRFFWLPNFLETLLVQVWYPISVATQAREFKKTIQAYSVLSQRTSHLPAEMGPPEFTEANIAEDQLAIHIAQVFDLLDFGYRGVSSHETASLGSAAYYTTGFEGSDTVAGSRMLLQYYNATDKSLPPILASFKGTFEQGHGATSLPAAEHSTITSWADVSPDADYVEYECAEYAAFTNMIKQYMPSFCVSLVSDGFNIWNAVTNLWPCAEELNGCPSMRAMLAERLANGQATIVRPDSGEGVETLPQLLTVLSLVLPEHWETELPELVSIFPEGDSHEGKYFTVIQKIMGKLGMSAGNPFRRLKGQQLRVLQGDGVALDSVGDMCASILANGFCVNAVNFGSGGGLLQKLNRDSLGVAFKCCAMYVGGNTYPVGKDPIAGGKKSYGGNPAVLRGEDGVLRNRGMYEQNADGSFGAMVEAVPMTYDEFINGAEGDELQEVFKDGIMTKEQNFTEIKHRAKIVNLDATIRKAVDNLELKCDFLQKMTSDEAIAIRLAEASVGSKWSHTHPTRLGELQQSLPQYADAFSRLGLTAAMSSTDVLKHIKDNHICDRSAKKTIFKALEADDPDKAIKAMGSKVCITL